MGKKEYMKYRPTIQTGARFLSREQQGTVEHPWIARFPIQVKTVLDGKRIAIRNDHPSLLLQR